MDIRSKLYPYPVLSSANDDYTGSSFTFTPNISKGPREVVFDFALNLQDSTLQQLIGEGQAEFVIHIECPYTAFREIIRCSSESCSRHIVESRLNGKVSVCAFIVAKQDIHGYTNPAFNADYSDISFDIERGGILAVGGQCSVDIIKETDELAKVPSIFSICRSAMDSDESMKIDLDGEKIAITLCAESFSNYRVMSDSPAYLPVFHSILILPALIYVFETLKRSGTEDFEQRRWFRAIRRTLYAQGLKLDQTTLDTYESFELAWENSNTQELIDILDEYDARATFFVTGDWCDRYPDDVKMFADAGHEIQNHSDVHPHVKGMNVNDLITDTKSASQKIKDITGTEPTLYRAPYGEYDDTVITTIEGMGLTVIQWDVEALDIDGKPLPEPVQATGAVFSAKRAL